MRKSTVLSIGFAACCWVLLPAHGQSQNLPPKNTASEGHTVRSEVLFPIGQGRLNPDLGDNRSHLFRFTEELNRILADTNYVVSRIAVSGSASPDGELNRNLQLAGQRAASLRDYLMAQCRLPADKIEMINLGENWPTLRSMIERSNMPYRNEMLQIIDRNPDDRDARKYKMMFYADSKPWTWMYEHFFPELRTGAGCSQGRASLAVMSTGNWGRMREIIRTSDIDAQTQQALLKVIDNEADPKQRMSRMQALCPDMSTYAQLQSAMIAGLLCEASVLSADNWTLLREQIAASNMPSRDAILHIIDTTPIANGREQQLRALEGGEPYRQILDRFFPELLVSSRGTHVEEAAGKPGVETPLRDENWKRLREMVVLSDMPDRDAVLVLIDQEPNPAIRGYKLYAMNNGDTYRYINEVFFPELLYGISPAAQHNWEQLSNMVGRSNLAHKSEILEIIRTTSPGLLREEAIRALDGGDSWLRMSEMLLPELLSNSAQVTLSGSGMSFSYELSPAAKERAAALAQKQAAERQTMQAEVLGNSATQPTSGQSAQEQIPAPMTTRQKAKAFSPRIALKTDLVLWGGVMPDFKMGTWTPNLFLELYFARRWSVQAGGAYSNWNTLSGTKELYAVSVGDLELRHWFGKPSRFRGFYLGVYGQFGEYDVQTFPTAQTGSFWCAGLGAGWMQQLSRHWAIEAEVRGGYRSAKNGFYDIERDAAGAPHYFYNHPSTESKFMPSVRLNIVYRIGKSDK